VENSKDKNISSNSSVADYVAMAAKSIVGAVPFVGSLLVEIVGTTIPNQRTDRIAKFASILEERLSQVEQAHVRAQITNENFTDLIEEAVRQVARSTSDERREHIANLVEEGVKSDDISFIESKHLLRILGEINDIEVIWLRFYQNPMMSGDSEFRAKHEQILRPIRTHLGSPQADVDKSTLNNSYKEHLVRLGLLKESFKVDSKTKMPSFDSRTGAPQHHGYSLTRFGRLLLRQIGLGDDNQDFGVNR
jgi:hypothetical protein